MKYFMAFCWLCIFSPARSQDLIIKKNGDTLLGKVTLVTPNQVQYKKGNSTDTNIVIIPASSLSSITYSNGLRDTFNTSNTALSSYTSGTYSNQRLSERGKQDARQYYKEYKDSRTLTVLVSLIPFYGPAAGFVPAIAFSSSPPKSRNLSYPYPELMVNPEYSNAYRHEAYRIKKKKTWGGYLLGTSISAGLTLMGVAIIIAAFH